MSGSLTDRQQRFAAEYLVDLNATQAAIRAGYSERTAESQGSRLLRNVKVLQAIAQGKAARSKRVEIDQDRVLRQAAAIAFGRITDIAEWDEHGVRLRRSSLLTDDELAPIAAVEQLAGMDRGEGEEVSRPRIKVKCVDRVRALELLMRHLGMLRDEVKVTGLEGLTDAIWQARQRYRPPAEDGQ